MSDKHDQTMRRHLAAISAILARCPQEKQAAPYLRRLTIKLHLRRYRVFAAYRFLKKQREQE